MCLVAATLVPSFKTSLDLLYENDHTPSQRPFLISVFWDKRVCHPIQVRQLVPETRRCAGDQMVVPSGRDFLVLDQE